MSRSFIKSTYITYLVNDKQFFTAVSFICLYMYAISPMVECAALFEEPINLFEVFLTFINNGFCIPLIIITFLVTIIDFPDIGRNAGFILIRSGRNKWYLNQLLFLLVTISGFLASLFIFSLIFVFGNSFVINGWSNVIRDLQLDLYLELRTKYPLAGIDLTVINNFRPYTALVYSLIFAVLQFLLYGQLQICFCMKFNRLVGICASFATLGMGLALWAASSGLKWLLPFANATIGWHYDQAFNLTLYPLWASFLYLLVANLLLYFFGQQIIKNKQLYLEVIADDRDN